MSQPQPDGPMFILYVGTPIDTHDAAIVECDPSEKRLRRATRKYHLADYGTVALYGYDIVNGEAINERLIEVFTR